MNAVDIGTGTTITFGTSGFAAELTSVKMSGISRAIIETSHLATPAATTGTIGSKTFLAGKLSDPGELAIEGHFDADLEPPVEGDPETITITFPLADGESTASSWSFSGQMTNYEFGAPLEDKMTFTATVKAVGPITVTEAVPTST
jgi:hypothetical protein